ncbi:PRC-barrel domain-containing protein [Wenxinia marina]|uniref:PRC-barrel domain protein n=1 Tax=Wenxinia marina DSM 24838 TaxID=1123501 RepID=A0A0D0Q8U1_9RHOB|nr:PRC-barrel domain-containing protein [Wenxinia marina]KIQ68787.1 PRC-barrel domain protein [Wenxinia marina DSM 24838]
MFRYALPLALIAATPLVAQDTNDEAEAALEGAVMEDEAVTDDAPMETAGAEATYAPEQPTGPMVRAEDIEDARVYALADAYDANFWTSGEPFGAVSADWGEVGEVEDLIIDPAGSVVGVTVEVGGFLGIGEKNVLIPLSDLRLVQQPGEDEFYIVTRLSNEQLEELDDLDDVLDPEDD